MSSGNAPGKWNKLTLTQHFCTMAERHFSDIVTVRAAHEYDILDQEVRLDPATQEPVFVFVFRESARHKDLSDVPAALGTPGAGGIPVKVDFLSPK
jgi:hypothetical protein